MQFVALAVETASSDMSSICEIGAATFGEAETPDVWQVTVNPEVEMAVLNPRVHGITAERIMKAPTLPQLYPELRAKLAGQLVVSHAGYDRACLVKALANYGLAPIPCSWLDSSLVACRAWEQFAVKGYDLSNVANTLGIVREHVGAGENARVVGEIVLRAIAHTGIALEEWEGQVAPTPPRRKRARRRIRWPWAKSG